MNLAMFQKMLFRIAHCWATHVDIDEYCELLQYIYTRIIVKKIIRGETGETEIALPRIQIEMFQSSKEEQDGNPWESCLSDEYQDDDYEYMHKEDPFQPEKNKRYKRRIPDGTNQDDGSIPINTNEPLLYIEEVQFYREPKEGDFNGAVKAPSDSDIAVDLLADLNDVYPLGYPTEQFIFKLKNDVIAAFKQLKEDRKKAIDEMRRQMFEKGGGMKVERPPEI